MEDRTRTLNVFLLALLGLLLGMVTRVGAVLLRDVIVNGVLRPRLERLGGCIGLGEQLVDGPVVIAALRKRIPR